ncbi:hypothetical protein [Natronobacterium lacisalsi]|uniref:hypothetical protein n=1 Tax=Natronobacterium lacisalsi TaxID=229731 RepID=UPI0006781F5B|nr:hypothetical protein [Halobiforma lacisalsi]
MSGCGINALVVVTDPPIVSVVIHPATLPQSDECQLDGGLFRVCPLGVLVLRERFIGVLAKEVEDLCGIRSSYRTNAPVLFVSDFLEPVFADGHIHRIIEADATGLDPVEEADTQ